MFKALVLMTLALVLLSVIPGEIDNRIWIYSSDHCAACKRLKKDIEAGALKQFEIIYKKPPPGIDIPQITYYKADGTVGYYIGWGSEAEFIKQWRKDHP